MKKHTIVMIYQDPITQEKPEGEALLLRKVADWPDGLERWKVCFRGEDGEVYERTIRAESQLLTQQTKRAVKEEFNINVSRVKAKHETKQRRIEMPYCERCPIMYQCPAWDKADGENTTSYHPQQIVRVSEYADEDCPLVKLIEPKAEGESQLLTLARVGCYIKQGGNKRDEDSLE